MIPCWPPMHEDELLYSVVARLHEFLAPRASLNDFMTLFLDKQTVIHPLLPNGVADVVAHLPQGHPLTVAQLVNRHTLSPFFLSTLEPKQRAVVEERIRQGETFLRTVTHAPFLRYCPACAVHDRQRTRTAYWHRAHQIPGIDVCPTHHLFLVASSVPAGNRGRPTLISAETVVPDAMTATPLNPSDPAHQFLLRYAQNAIHIVGHVGPGAGPAMLSELYRRILESRGLAYRGGQLAHQDILKELDSWPGLRDWLHTWSWPGALEGFLTRHRRSGASPAFHLILLDFLGLTADVMTTVHTYDRVVQSTPSAAAPWPRRSRLDREARRARWLQMRADHPDAGRSELTRLCQTDYSWLRTNDPEWLELHSPPPRQPGRKKHATSPSPRRTQGTTTSPIDDHTIAFDARRARYRATWSALRAQHPTATRTELRKLAPGPYYWLWMHDAKWLDQSSPVRKSGRRSVIGDHELADEVRRAADTIRTHPGRPIQVTRSELSRFVGRRIFQIAPEIFPETARVLAEVLESREMFAIRRG